MGQAVADTDTFASYADKIRAIRTGVETGDATAGTGDILSGKTAYVKGQKITGNIQSQDARTVTPGTSSQTAVAAKRYTTGAVTVAGDANLKAENIVKGVSIFGVTGSTKAVETATVKLLTSGGSAAAYISTVITGGAFTEVRFGSDGVTLELPVNTLIFSNYTVTSVSSGITKATSAPFLGTSYECCVVTSSGAQEMVFYNVAVPVF